MWCAADVLVGTSFWLSESVSLSESHSQNLSALFPLSHSLSLWVPFSLSDTLHCRKKLTFQVWIRFLSLSLCLSLSHTQNDTATGN